jgi:tungstate transport system ATP-binding protein
MMNADAPPILPLELTDVSLEIGGQRLIKDLSCRFEAPAISIVIGPNGAGKSLLLRLCHGLLTPSAGSVRWLGAAGRNPLDYQAMVFQRPVLLRRSVAANIEEALGRAGLKRFARTSARVLSFGEQQRLALARSWALRPQVLFLDEPTASIDPAATHVIEEVILAMRAEGTKIIMSTHDLGQARRLADEVLFLHRGRLMEKAASASFFDGPKNDLAEAFLRGDLLWWKRRELTPP